MYNITSVLSEEHQHILKVIKVVLVECRNLESGKAMNMDFFRKVLGFIKNYADGFHHAKEENILFKAMLDNSAYMHCNPIPVMLHEHESGRHYVAGMEKALGEENTVNLIQHARGYCYLLENHIYKEENVLYPMAEEAVNDNQKKEVINLYAAIHQNDYFPSDIHEFIDALDSASAY